MGDTCLVGPSASFDAIAYARAMIEDVDSTSFVIPDSSMEVLVKKAASEFSRHLALDDVVGNPAQATSPCMTVANQQRYVCTAANGFAVTPSKISDVLYRAAATYSAANELAYLSLLPFSPVNRFLFTPNLLDSPSERILRNQYLDELQHYGRGYYAIVRDRVTGLLAVDLFPIPTSTPVPVFFRYQAPHPNSSTDPHNPVYATIPDDLAYVFGDLLYADCLDMEADRLAKYQRARAGLLDVQGSAADLRELASEVRMRAMMPLNAYSGVGLVSN